MGRGLAKSAAALLLRQTTTAQSATLSAAAIESSSFVKLFDITGRMGAQRLFTSQSGVRIGLLGKACVRPY